GMAFAVGKGVPLPTSLVNICKEIESETVVLPNGSTLTGWASQGVLLLNTVLTVREHTPQSHADLGWQTFTDAVIESLARREEPMVFMLWGANALRKSRLSRRAILFSKAFTQVRSRRTAAFSAADISSKPTTSSFPARSRPSTGRTRTTTRRTTIPTTAR
ncbi:MAG: uracil-DNA glycosylase, partial [Christensenellales bacterium]